MSDASTGVVGDPPNQNRCDLPATDLAISLQLFQTLESPVLLDRELVRDLPSAEERVLRATNDVEDLLVTHSWHASSHFREILRPSTKSYRIRELLYTCGLVVAQTLSGWGFNTVIEMVTRRYYPGAARSSSRRPGLSRAAGCHHYRHEIKRVRAPKSQRTRYQRIQTVGWFFVAPFSQYCTMGSNGMVRV